ncbi:hypothetical protein ALC57_13319, partial [Trachymyrmex cornetzi]
ENVKKTFLKWNLRKNVWNKISNFQIQHVWFTSLFICNEQFSKSVRSYCILYVINTSNIIFYTSRNLSNYYYVQGFFYEIHFQVLLKIGGTR